MAATSASGLQASSPEVSLPADLDEFEKRLSKLEKKERDNWDKVHILGTLIQPLVIAAAGIALSYFTFRHQQQESAQNKIFRDERIKVDDQVKKDRDAQEELRQLQDFRQQLKTLHLEQAKLLRQYSDDILAKETSSAEVQARGLLLCLQSDAAHFLSDLKKIASTDAGKQPLVALFDKLISERRDRLLLLLERGLDDTGTEEIMGELSSPLSPWIQDGTLGPVMVEHLERAVAGPVPDAWATAGILKFLSGLKKQHFKYLFETSPKMRGLLDEVERKLRDEEIVREVNFASAVNALRKDHFPDNLNP